MATWQHTYYLAPQSKLLERYGVIPSEINEDDLDEIHWWEGMPVPPSGELEAILPKAVCTWSDLIEYWGAENGNLISYLYSEERKLAEVRIRVDLRTNFEKLRELVQKLVDLAQRYDCYFISEYNLLIPADYEAVASDLKRSDAQTYVNSPLSEIVDHALETGNFRVVEMKLDDVKPFDVSILRDPEDEEESEDEELV